MILNVIGESSNSQHANLPVGDEGIKEGKIKTKSSTHQQTHRIGIISQHSASNQGIQNQTAMQGNPQHRPMIIINCN